MARKIFVSYKHTDADVRALHSGGLLGTTARHYVDELQAHLDANDHIYKGENDDESLQGFRDDTIASKLRDKIFDSTITLVLISKNMKDYSVSENDQWIPWEISYSLKEMTRDGRTSGTNAVVAIVIPDRDGSYNHFFRDNTCSSCNSRMLMTDAVFKILGSNMFNRKQPKKINCQNHSLGNEPHIGEDHSYVYSVKWDDFISNINMHLSIADQINQNMNDYNLVKIP